MLDGRSGDEGMTVRPPEVDGTRGTCRNEDVLWIIGLGGAGVVLGAEVDVSTGGRATGEALSGGREGGIANGPVVDCVPWLVSTDNM